MSGVFRVRNKTVHNEDGVMTSNNEHVLPVGARVLPGIDLTLWFAIVLASLVSVSLCVAGIAIAIH